MKRILKRYLAILLVFVLALQVIDVNVLAENDTVISAQSEAETTEKKEAEVKAEEKTTEVKQSKEKKQESSESKKEEKTEAKKEETTQNKPENATTEVAQEATTEASEAASEATIEEEKEEAAFSSKVKQTAMVSEDGQLSVRYSVTVTNTAQNAKAEDFTVKIAFGKNVTYYADDRQTSGLNYVKDLANMPSGLNFDELTGSYVSATIWKDQNLDAGDSKTYEVYAKAGEEALSISDLQPAFYVAGKRVEAADIQWTNSALIEEKLEDTTKTYTYEDDEKTVTAVVSDKNALPADAEFVVKNVSAKRIEEVEELLREQLVNKAAKKAKGQDVQDIAGLVVYDMHFAVDGKEIEPENAEVKVSIQFKKAKDLSADDTKVSVEDAVIMHIEDNGKITDVTDDVILTKKGKVSGGEFTTDSFSEYAVTLLSGGAPTLEYNQVLIEKANFTSTILKLTAATGVEFPNNMGNMNISFKYLDVSYTEVTGINPTSRSTQVSQVVNGYYLQNDLNNINNSSVEYCLITLDDSVLTNNFLRLSPAGPVKNGNTVEFTVENLTLEPGEEWSSPDGNYHYIAVGEQNQYDTYGALGLANDFHIVAFSEATTGTHTNGNIMTELLHYQSNFGTNGLSNEISYLKNIDISGGEIKLTDSSILVVGKDSRVTFKDGQFWVNGVKVSGVKTIMQDTEQYSYIDIEAVRKNVIELSNDLASKADTEGTVNKEGNTYTINGSGTNVCNLTVDDLNNISEGLLNLVFNKENPGTLVINIDARGADKVVIPGTSIRGLDNVSGEVTDFSSGKIIWNVYDSTTSNGTYKGNVENNKATSGVVLVPNGTFTTNANWNGSMVADKVYVRAESHRTDFSGTLGSFKVKKSIEGREWNTSDSFKFILRAVDGGPMPGGVERGGSMTIQATKANKTPGFGIIKFTSEQDAGKTYTYTISEISGSESGMIYSTDIYTAKVRVSQNASSLKIEYSQDGGVTWSEDEPEAFAFVNKYQADKGSLIIKKNVTLNGESTTGTEADGTYKFTVKDANSITVKEISVAIKDGASESVRVDGLEPGEYTVSETEIPSGMSLTGSNNVKVTVTAKNTAGVPTAEFTNNKDKVNGSLKIQKNVTVNGKATSGTEADGTYYFTVTDAKGTVVKEDVGVTVTNGASATETVEGLEPGEYTVSEQTDKLTQDMSLVGNNDIKVTVTADKTVEVPTAEFTNNKVVTGSLKFKKVISGDVSDNDLTDEQKANITFTVTGPNDYRKVITYDQFTNGSYTINNLPTGEYTVVETGADVLNGYSHSVTYSVTGGQAAVNKDQTSEITITNTYTRKRGSIDVTKYVYQIYDNELVEIIPKEAQFRIGLFTDQNGTQLYEGDDGEYESIRTVTLENQSASTVTFDNLPVGETYYLYEVREDGTAVKDGEKVDDYSYCQVSEGSSSKVEMALNADEVPEKVNLDNVYFDLPEGWKYNASISVSKELIKNGEVVTEDGDEIFRIGIFKETDLKNPFRTVEIKAGEALKVPVELGGENGDESIKYYIYELNDDGERADRDPGFVYDITVDKSNNEVTVTKENTDHFVQITNTEKTAFMALRARKMLDEKVPGEEKFAFGLFEQGSDTPLQTKNNDTDGIISFDEITYTYADIGTKIYEVKEIVPEQKKAYVYDKTVYTVKVTISNDNGTLKTDVELMKGDQKVTEMQFNNRSTKLSVQKVDYETGKTVSNATLAVFDKDNQEIERWISGEEAHEISGKLIVGETYTLRELKAPEGYYLAADMSFTVPEDGIISLTMKDLKLKKKSGQIQVTKQISYLDADFNIVDLIANDAVFKVGLYTDSEGKHPYGNDYIREIHLVNQSVSNPVVYKNLPTGTYYVFELDKDGNPITTIDMQTDGGKRYSCNVDGDDPANTSLALDLNADVVEGKINLQNVYYDIPDGYRYKASINVTKEVLKNSTKVTVNDTFYAGVFTRNEAEEYELYTVAELVQNGTVKFDVPLGGDNGDEPVTYYVFETDNEGNLIDQSVFAYDISGEGEVTVSKDNIVADKKITNTTNDTKESSVLLDIMKITEDGNSLKGATFELTSEDGEIVATWTSEKQSKKFALKPGTYTLEELKAPKGYILGSDVEITIDENGEITVSGENVTLDESTLKYINEKETTKKTEKKKSTTSKTGDRTPIGFWLILCLGAVTMLVFFGIRRLYFRGSHNR